VMTVVKKVYDTIDRALDTAIGFVLGKAKGFLSKLFAKGGCEGRHAGQGGGLGQGGRIRHHRPHEGTGSTRRRGA
jgi:hypothetical protein